MQDALAHLVAVVLGTPAELGSSAEPDTCEKHTNLWYHLFSPDKLNVSFIPGFHVSKDLFYSVEKK